LRSGNLQRTQGTGETQGASGGQPSGLGEVADEFPNGSCSTDFTSDLRSAVSKRVSETGR